jgi:hypothetical protein
MSGGPRRWREQRWLVDETIRTQGIEFDQPRLGYHLGPVGDDLAPADAAVIRGGVRKIMNQSRKGKAVIATSNGLSTDQARCF